MQNTFFSARSLSSRSFALSSSNSEVTVSIANVHDPSASVLVLCGSAAALPLLGPSTGLSREAVSGLLQVCLWFLMYREKMVMLLLLLGSHKYEYLYRQERIELCPGVY